MLKTLTPSLIRSVAVRAKRLLPVVASVGLSLSLSAVNVYAQIPQMPLQQVTTGGNTLLIWAVRVLALVACVSLVVTVIMSFFDMKRAVYGIATLIGSLVLGLVGFGFLMFFLPTGMSAFRVVF